MYYKQLKSKTMGYKSIKISVYLKHLNEKWCKINTNTSKITKATYYNNWIQEEHITVFVKRINNEQAELMYAKIVIADK